jgi:intein/homing endonuclease
MEFKGDNVKEYDSRKNDKIYKECKWDVSNKHLWNVLNSYGCTPRKSLTVKFPNESIFKSKDLIRHFIRGYFDGDGSITYANKAHTAAKTHIAGSESFLKSLQLYLAPELQTQELYFGTNIYVLSYGHNNAFTLINYLYNNSTIYLNRKLGIFNYFSRLY